MTQKNTFKFGLCVFLAAFGLTVQSCNSRQAVFMAAEQHDASDWTNEADEELRFFSPAGPPVEWYQPHWTSFNEAVTVSNAPLEASMIEEDVATSFRVPKRLKTRNIGSTLEVNAKLAFAISGTELSPSQNFFDLDSLEIDVTSSDFSEEKLNEYRTFLLKRSGSQMFVGLLTTTGAFIWSPIFLCGLLFVFSGLLNRTIALNPTKLSAYIKKRVDNGIMEPTPLGRRILKWILGIFVSLVTFFVIALRNL